MNAKTLPPLPEPTQGLGSHRWAYSADDMLAYAATAIAAELEALRAERDALRVELERERMRLAACGVVALSDTPQSAAAARNMHDDYRSAACDDVARRVDECMALRAERDALLAALNEIAWSNDSKWQADRARSAIDAARAGGGNE